MIFFFTMIFELVLLGDKIDSFFDSQADNNSFKLTESIQVSVHRYRATDRQGFGRSESWAILLENIKKIDKLKYYYLSPVDQSLVY